MAGQTTEHRVLNVWCEHLLRYSDISPRSWVVALALRSLKVRLFREDECRGSARRCMWAVEFSLDHKAESESAWALQRLQVSKCCRRCVLRQAGFTHARPPASRRCHSRRNGMVWCS